MIHRSTLKSSPSNYAITLPNTLIIQHFAGWNSLYYDFSVRKPGLLVVRGWRYFTLFVEPQASGVALLKELTKLNTRVPDVCLIHLSTDRLG